MRITWLLVAGTLVAAACGTSRLELPDDSAAASQIDGADGAPPRPSTTASSTTASTTTASTTTTSTTTTSTTVPPFVVDEAGVPVNGQADGVLITPSGWRVPVLGATETGWRVWTPCGREAHATAGTLVDHADVVLDPGHGGSEPGATGANGLLEKDLNLAVARLAAEGLRAAGYSVLLTRADDVRIPIVTRAEIALAVDPIALVSIHHNAGTDAPSPEPGTEMFHQIDSVDSRRLAGILFEETRAVLDRFDVAWVAMGDAGALVRENREGGDFYGMLRRPRAVPSVISEAAYLSNPPEADLLERADVREALAGAVVAAVDRFATTSDPGSGFSENPIFRGYESTGTGRTTNCDDPDLD